MPMKVRAPVLMSPALEPLKMNVVRANPARPNGAGSAADTASVVTSLEGWTATPSRLSVTVKSVDIIRYPFLRSVRNHTGHGFVSGLDKACPIKIVSMGAQYVNQEPVRGVDRSCCRQIPHLTD